MVGSEHVFVYGTLRPPQPDTPADDSRYYPQVAEYVQQAKPARVLNCALYNLGAYPGATRGNGVVRGDLLTVRSEAMAIMDRIEGHPTFFRREKVEVQTDNGLTKAWIYWASKGLVIGRRHITNGDWFKRNDDSGESMLVDDEPVSEVVDDTLKALVQRFADADCSWVSSVRPDSRAHSTPIWHVWHRGRAYIVASGTAVKTRNILENPNVVITHPDPLNTVIIEGWATPAAALEAELQPLFKAKYDWDISTDTEYDTIIEITPIKLMAWGKYGEGRWPGEAVLRVQSV